MRAWRTRHRLLAIGVLALVALVEAEARVGGGQGFSTGRPSGGGGGGGFGGGHGGDGGGGELVWLLIQLLIRYPKVGIPVLIVVVIVLLVGARNGNWQSTRFTIEGHPHGAPAIRRTDDGARRGWAKLAEEDEGLSEPVVQDFVQLVFRRAYEALGTGGWDPLAPFVGPDVRESLRAGNRDVTGVRDVVVASSPLTAVRRVGSHDELDVRFTSSRVETTDGGERTVYVEETWTFRRAVGAPSLAPDDTLRLGCPSCGAAVQCDAMGACGNCGTPITKGQLQWQASKAVVSLRRPITPPDVGVFAGGEEPSYRMPSVVAPDLAARIRAFHGHHPEFDADAWEGRLKHVFTALQTAWDAGRWDDARPYCTDASWNTLRFWMLRYRRAGLRNRLADVEILKVQLVKVGMDAWYESMTVRFWGKMKDWTEDEAGKVVGGNRDTDRYFSEYWTFLRAIGSGDSSGDPSACPSCGAPLDRINAAGQCGYCDSVITTGTFDWVLSRIDQAEVYRG